MCHRLADIVNDRNELAIDKCRRKGESSLFPFIVYSLSRPGITLPSEDIIALSFNNPGLPLDATVRFYTRHYFPARVTVDCTLDCFVFDLFLTVSMEIVEIQMGKSGQIETERALGGQMYDEGKR